MMARHSRTGVLIALAVAVMLGGSLWAVRAQPALTPVTLSIVGTTDLHGEVFADEGRGGLAMLGGYLRNLRAVRAADGGALLLLDAGDTFQGGVWSNLSEGTLVVDAYNALGYDALAIGNHDFEFGARDDGRAPGDLRGALKAAAARAGFPFLAANIVDAGTGRPVDWPNVRPSVALDAAGVRVGIVGVMTPYGLNQTLAANVGGLATTPLLSAVEQEAAALRAAGADVVVVLAHAGGRCEQFDDTADVSSCDPDSEIFRLARALPVGLVDAIVAGHSHGAVAHEVAGVPIVQAWARGRGFARVDLTIASDGVTARVFPPEEVVAGSRYEGAAVTSDPDVTAAMAPVLDRVAAWRAEPVSTMPGPIARDDGLESPLGHVFADAMRAAVPDADVAIGLWPRRGGLRGDLLAGPVTRGSLYDAFPFDNRIARVELTGARLGEWLDASVRSGRGLPGLSGLVARVLCAADGGLRVALAWPSGADVTPETRLVVAAMDSFVSRAGFGGDAAGMLAHAPLVREAVLEWLGNPRRVTAVPPRWRSATGCIPGA